MHTKTDKNWEEWHGGDGSADTIIQPNNNKLAGERTQTKQYPGELTPPEGFEYFGKPDCWGIRQMRHIKSGITAQEYDRGR